MLHRQLSVGMMCWNLELLIGSWYWFIFVMRHTYFPQWSWNSGACCNNPHMTWQWHLKCKNWCLQHSLCTYATKRSLVPPCFGVTLQQCFIDHVYLILNSSINQKRPTPSQVECQRWERQKKSADSFSQIGPPQLFFPCTSIILREVFKLAATLKGRPTLEGVKKTSTSTYPSAHTVWIG